jgi:hypothetical protein
MPGDAPAGRGDFDFDRKSYLKRRAGELGRNEYEAVLKPHCLCGFGRTARSAGQSLRPLTELISSGISFWQRDLIDNQVPRGWASTKARSSVTSLVRLQNRRSDFIP